MSQLPEYRKVKGSYRSGDDTLRQQFFEPCFRDCTSYSRAVGFFTSTSLRTWASALVRLPAQSIAIRLLIGPALSQEDSEVVQDSFSKGISSSLQLLGDDFLERALRFADGDDDERIAVFRSLLASRALIIKFAFTESGEGIYHEKIGVFVFPNGDWISFDGSPNESEYGHSKNFERVQVFRSWEDMDIVRGKQIIDDFEAAWEGRAAGLRVFSPSKEVLDRVTKRPHLRGPKEGRSQGEKNRWKHQDLAVDAFLATKRGVLEMATGTGKTRTALRIASDLINAGQIDRIVISMTGTDLLNQWAREITDWGRASSVDWPLLRYYERYKQLDVFRVIGPQSMLLVSRTSLHKLRHLLSADELNRTLIVHDEVHGLGSPSARTQLAGFHQGFGYVLGLSATPEREYDDDGSAFIASEIGSVVYRFGLEDAIRKGILTELDYSPLTYDLSDDERARIAKYFSMKVSDDGGALSQEDVWRMIASVYKSAESKLESFSKYLDHNPDVLERCIIFVSDTEYGKKVMELIHAFTHNYKGYFAGEDEKYLIDFARGRISTLITCHRVSQGIDIKDVRSIVLFSSD